MPGTNHKTDAVPRAPTGVAGLDEIAGGGLPKGSVTLLIGSAGAGKTVLALQVLAHGAVNSNEPGIFVSFEEPSSRILTHSAGFDWGGAQLTRNGVQLIDAQLGQIVEHGGAFDLLGLLAVVEAQARQSGALRVVFDGLDVLLAYLDDVTLIRRELFRLRDWVYRTSMTAIVTAKMTSDDARSSGDDEFLQFLADCVITLQHRMVQSTALRSMRVAKYRGVSHSANEYPMIIGEGGLEVASHTQIELAHPASAQRVSTGVDRLDGMLSGGYYRGSSVLITGVPGTAKTSLAAAFAEAAAKRGEPTLYVSFDEAPLQVERNVASIGIQFEPLLAAGVLFVRSFRGRANSPEAHVARIRALLRELRPQNLVIDPLSALAQKGSDIDAEGAALQILDLAKASGTTVLSTSLLGNMAPLTEQTPLNISTIADTWMHLSYSNQGGERNRSLTIVKSRGTRHSNQVRELILSEAGITLADVYSVDGEVLMGTLRWQKETEARRARELLATDAALRERKAQLALAETRAHIETLTREEAVREAELTLLRARSTSEVTDLTSEIDELRHRRGVDFDDAVLRHPQRSWTP